MSRDIPPLYHISFDPVAIYYCGNIIARLKDPIKGMQVHPFNDKSMKTIQSNVPDGDELIFSQ